MLFVWQLFLRLFLWRIRSFRITNRVLRQLRNNTDEWKMCCYGQHWDGLYRGQVSIMIRTGQLLHEDIEIGLPRLQRMRLRRAVGTIVTGRVLKRM